MLPLHQRAKDVFIAALERPPADRRTFLADACGGDEALQHEVESLLDFHEESTHGSAKGEPALAPESPFAPGDLFAGRYRMVHRLGRGGMGDVWAADDLVLQTRVALKAIYSANAESRSRLLNEVRLARQITHPSVCRVFDVGEAGGGIFYTMEFVHGEDLASLIRRVGRLPSEKVIDIGLQLSGGLAAAHAQGVLHRDLKPANVLIDNDGAVRITDFGIAIPRAEAGGRSALTGTPAYMAPEQRTVGAPLSERTDIYALGLLLYELLVGRHAVDPRTGATQAAPSALVSDVDPVLERMIMQAISPDPADRPASAFDMAAKLADRVNVHVRPDTGRATARALPPAGASSWWLRGAAIALAIGALAILASYFVSPRGDRLTEQDAIVLADFENTTGEPVFDGALKVALAVALEQSPFLKVFPDDRARETLRLMERRPDERITRAVAREIARREQVKALLAGSIASLGRNYVLALEAVNAETGDVMAREQAEAGSKEEVLTALGAAAAHIREKLGESLASVRKFDAPLPRATTPSLDALHAYSLALDEGREVPRLEAVPHLKRAIELDPTFAMAHAQLSAVYANTGQSALAPTYSTRAFELRDRVSERERYFISWRYYRDAAQDFDKALDLARSWTAAYPREAFAFNALGSALIRLGQFEASVGPFRDAIRLDPKFSPAYANLAAALVAVDKRDDARGILSQAAARGLNFAGARRLSYLIAVLEGDAQTMTKELDSSVGLQETGAAFGWQAHASAYTGRIAAAHDQFHLGIQMARRGAFDQVAAQLSVEDAEIHAIIGECDDARADLSAALEWSRDNVTLGRASRALALCGTAREVEALTAELTRRFPEATLTVNVTVPVARAALAIRERQPERALELLERTRPYDHSPSAEFWPAYLRGQAHMLMKDGRAAVADFRQIVDHRGEVPVATLYPLAHVSLARAAMMVDDQATARTAYDYFMTAWKDADPELRPLKEARVERAKLP
jgi:tetratricopeptide (TPR) repeat protein